MHDLDLKDGRFGAPEASAISAVIDGLQLAHADDDVLLAQRRTLFDALYRGFSQAMRKAGPRAVARSRQNDFVTLPSRVTTVAGPVAPTTVMA